MDTSQTNKEEAKVEEEKAEVVNTEEKKEEVQTEDPVKTKSER